MSYFMYKAMEWLFSYARQEEKKYVPHFRNIGVPHVHGKLNGARQSEIQQEIEDLKAEINELKKALADIKGSNKKESD